ncbi:MAG: ABC transporter ATP-binding protein [Proteobacteria bacterium]|nr:ABC transporter ATP-binding protein [Pseudomonadota bacterium]NBX86455.1 ABC transporter ATP-binding protein [Pseudomonadota bacterium]
MLTISNLTYRIAGRTILENTSAVVQQGWKVGVVGPNGAGKSTLFKLIAGELHADSGEIQLASQHTIGMVRQDIRADDTPLLDIVLEADTERTELLKAAETEADPYKIADIYTRLGEIDAYAAPARASTILAGLGFKETDLSQPIKAFSGGWRMRVALAAALFQQPDFLLLDEPTNHLDLEAIMWLENYLQTYPKTILIISHDRDLLNTCITHVIHVENQKLTAYTGNYNSFERERAEKLMSQQKLHEKQQAQRAHMQAFVDRFKAKASKAKQAQSRLKALEKMDVVDAVMAERTVKFTFPQPEELAPPILSVFEADIGYTPGKPVLRGVDERIDMDDRIALLGANGNGKSTLIKLIAGKLEPLKGSTAKSSKLRIGYFSQHQAEELDVSETPYQAMARVVGSSGANAVATTRESAVRAILGRFGFSKPLADNRISSLSGGEKARLLFALMSYNAPHLLLLDEPTNHLDMDTREALVQALNAYQGAVIIVSHDPSMVERVADRLWLVSNGSVQPFDGDLAAYRQHIVTQRRQEKRDQKSASQAASSSAVSTEPTPSKKEQQAALKAKRQRHPKLHEAIQLAEKNLSKLTREQKETELALAAPNLPKSELKDLQFTYANLQKEIEEAEAELLQAMEAFDNAS